MKQSGCKKILSRIYGSGRGKVFTPKDFHDLATGETVRQTLGRLTETGTIRRLMRGVYDYPVFSNLFQAPANPDPNSIAHAIARAFGWTIFPAGETALNVLGLSTQIQARYQYFSDGPSKKYDWSGGNLEFIHRPNKEITILSPKTAMLVQALKALGKERVNESVLLILRSKLNARELRRAESEARYVTTWVYEFIKRLSAE